MLAKTKPAFPYLVKVKSKVTVLFTKIKAISRRLGFWKNGKIRGLKRSC